MLHILRLSLPNVYLLTGEKAVLVDAGGPRDVPRILAFLEAHGVGAGKLALILLTHGHWDHAGGAAELKARTGAPVAIHPGDADLVRRGTNGTLLPTRLFATLLRPFADRSFPPCVPDLLIDEEWDLARFGVAARVLFTPGHTPGSISVFTGEEDMIVGDLLMGGCFGGWLFPTRPCLHYFAENTTQLRSSIVKVIAAAPRRILPGHGGPLEPQRVSSFAFASGL